MAIQTFVANTILTAAQLNTLQANDYNQTVSTKTASYTLVAADKGTRVVMNVASANTVTVNTSLFSAGDTLVIQNIGAGVTTVTAGTATVSSAGPLAIPQNGSGTLYFTSAGVSLFFPSAGPAASSGLTFISGGSIGTSTTFSLPASSFSATYLNYFLMLNAIKTNGGGDNLMMRMRAAGTDDTGSNYNSGVFTVDTSGTYAGIGGLGSASSFRIGSSNNTALGVTSGHIYFMNPQTVTLTSFGSQQYTSGLQTTGSGRLDTVTQYDSATFFTHNAASFNGGTYRLYGLADS